MTQGVVVVGYPGVGKSTLANKSSTFIDLESSNFRIDGSRDIHWFKPYCKVAVDLASQGYAVFVSSHDEVRDYLEKINIPSSVHVCCVVPSKDLKRDWMGKLWDRWRLTQLEKDFRAYVRAEEYFESDVDSIEKMYSVVCELKSLDYNLENDLCKTLKQYGIDVGIYKLA